MSNVLVTRFIHNCFARTFYISAYCFRLHSNPRPKQRERVVSFVPPDGAFTLMSYRVDGVTQMPLSVRPSVAVAGQTGRVHIAVSPRHNDRKAVEDLVLTIPLPKATLSTALSASGGSIRYDETRKIVRWEIGFLPESKQQVLEGTFELPAGYVHDEMTVVSVRCASTHTHFQSSASAAHSHVVTTLYFDLVTGRFQH